MACHQVALHELPAETLAVITSRLGAKSVLSLWKCGCAPLTRKLRYGGVRRLVLRDRYVAPHTPRIPAMVAALPHLREVRVEVTHAIVERSSATYLLHLPPTLTRLSLVCSAVNVLAHDVLRQYTALEYLQLEDPHADAHNQALPLCVFTVALPLCVFTVAPCPPLAPTLHTLKLSYCNFALASLTCDASAPSFFPPHLRTLRLDRRDMERVIAVSSLAPHLAFALPPSLERMTCLLSDDARRQPEHPPHPLCTVAEMRALPASLVALSLRLEVVWSSPNAYPAAFPPGLTSLEVTMPRAGSEALHALWLSLPRSLISLAVTMPLTGSAALRALWLSLPRSLTHLAISASGLTLQDGSADCLSSAELARLLPPRLQSVVIVKSLPLNLQADDPLPCTFWPSTLRHLTISNVGKELNAYHLLPHLETLSFVRPESVLRDLAQLRAFDLARLRVLKIGGMGAMNFGWLPSLTDLEYTRAHTHPPDAVAFPALPAPFRILHAGPV